MEQKATEERNNCLLTHLPGVLAVLRMTLLGPWQMAPGPMCQAEPGTEGNESDIEMEAWEAGKLPFQAWRFCPGVCTRMAIKETPGEMRRLYHLCFVDEEMGEK